MSPFDVLRAHLEVAVPKTDLLNLDVQAPSTRRTFWHGQSAVSPRSGRTPAAVACRGASVFVGGSDNLDQGSLQEDLVDRDLAAQKRPEPVLEDDRVEGASHAARRDLALDLNILETKALDQLEAEVPDLEPKPGRSFGLGEEPVADVADVDLDEEK